MLSLTEKEYRLIFLGDHPLFELVDDGMLSWEDQGKFHRTECIFKDPATSTFYKFQIIRTGDHWSGYDFDFSYSVAKEVVKATKTIEYWK
jgi:hypothetical protein